MDPRIFGVSLIAILILAAMSLYIAGKFPGNPLSSLVAKVP